MQEIFRANTGLMVVSALCVGAVFVLSAVGAIMKASGVSLKPIVFMAVLFSLILVPQLIGNLVIAVRPATRGLGASSAGEDTKGGGAGLEVSGGKFVRRDLVFGSGVNAGLIQDVRQAFAAVLSGAEAAELAMTETGETILAAQFRGEEEMWRAAAAYARTYELGDQSGVLETGLRGKAKLSGAFVEMLGWGRVLFVWTAISREAVEKRRALSVAAKVDESQVGEVTARREKAMASGAASNRLARVGAQTPAEPLFPSLQFLREIFRPLGVKVGGMLALGVVYVWVFFKGAAWSATVPADPMGTPVSAEELGKRLEAINGLDVPFRLEPGKRPGEWYATWRYADARWISVSNVHSMRRTFRVGLVLDEKSKVVRSTDYIASFDGRAGRDGAKLEWSAGIGLVLFQKERGRVFGIQLDERGRFKSDMSYSYRFSMDELKTPLIEAVVRSGWSWRPTVWQGPVWLRWLTE